MHSNETATGSAWNANESREPGTKLDHGKLKMISSKKASRMKTKKKLLNLAGTQLKEALASERNARRTGAQARAIMHDIKSSRGGCYLKGASKKGQRGRKGPKVQDKARPEIVMSEHQDNRRTRR